MNDVTRILSAIEQGDPQAKIAARHVGVTPEATLRADLQRVSQP
jgi:hypothetical protein